MASSRSAAPDSGADHTTSARARTRADDGREPSNAPTVLISLRRDQVLQAVAAAARELLRSPDLAVSLPKVIEQIGQVAGVDRAHILLIDPAAGEGRVLQHYTWSAPGIASPKEFRRAAAPMAEVGLKSWIAKLERGETIAGHVRDFDPDARKFFALGGVVSTLCVPAFADGRWSGIIAFDDCREERDWSATEIDTIKTMAELVGGAVARAEHLKTLADATRIIENSPTILYRVGPEVSVYTDLRVGERQPLRLSSRRIVEAPRALAAASMDAADRPMVLENTRAIGAGEVYSSSRRIPFAQTGRFGRYGSKATAPPCATETASWSPSRAFLPILPNAKAPKANCRFRTIC